jgi:multisubunit Na+/H+ antiporter MnhB subunit
MAHLAADLLMLSVSKHQIGGIVAIVVGALVLGFGVVRAAQRLSGAAIYCLIGAVVIVLGALLYAHVIRS